ncbi:MAG: DUF1622 domain-containing protein [Planctomycetota bacterium]
MNPEPAWIPTLGVAVDWHTACRWLAAAIAAAGVLVLVYGVGRAVVGFVRVEAGGSGRAARNRLRMDLGYYLLLGLEILVAADIIETLMAPDLEHVLVLGAIVLIRTVISFSLNWELIQERRHLTE